MKKVGEARRWPKQRTRFAVYVTVVLDPTGEREAGRLNHWNRPAIRA